MAYVLSSYNNAWIKGHIMKIINEDVKASKAFLNAWISLNKTLGDMEDKFVDDGNKKGSELVVKINKGLHDIDKLLDGFSNMIKYD